MRSKFTLLFTLPLFFCVSSCSDGAHKGENSTASNVDMNFTGVISTDKLMTNYPKFAKAYEDHQPESSDIQFFDKLAGMDIKVFFGVWCHDSQREVPRLLKLIELSQVKLNSLELIAIDQDKTLSEEYTDQFDVQFTPTFFVLQHNQILASVVEKPKNSLTKDLLAQILH